MSLLLLVVPSMSQDKKAPLKTKTFSGEGFTIDVPSRWTIEKEADGVRFVGAKSSGTNAMFTVTKTLVKPADLKSFSEKRKTQQAGKKHYREYFEKEISDGKGFMRMSRWAIEKPAVMLFVRDIFTASDQNVFLLTASFPHTMKFEEINPIFIKMVESFRFAQSKDE